MENTLTELMTFKGYPHWLQRRKNWIDIVSKTEINIGDGFTFRQHLETVDKSNMEVYRVTSIEDTKTLGKT